jgi:hypothetical protein
VTRESEPSYLQKSVTRRQVHHNIALCKNYPVAEAIAQSCRNMQWLVKHKMSYARLCRAEAGQTLNSKHEVKIRDIPHCAVIVATTNISGRALVGPQQAQSDRLMNSSPNTIRLVAVVMAEVVTTTPKYKAD